MKTKAVIRTATMADLPCLKTFEQGVVAAERPYAANLRPGRVTYYDIEALLDSRDSELLVAEVDNQLVACGYARIEHAKPQFTPNRYAYLGFMYVVPEHRGKNLIGMIMQQLIDWSHDHAVEAFKLDVYATNERAIRAYQKMGFKSNMLEMWKGPGQ